MSKTPKKNKQNDLQTESNKDSKKHPTDKKYDYDDWKRLEKWQIGRKNFC